mmetsp:Transcript_12054/g.19628  ORF Transcript_12054/g.19628 Transcript_12054/m.19628 type:complete len:220 (-) Transcript_12054:44-703(-)|eukprot:CAMPEP_0203768640 /NCGR_PEP_ID=MMETSP0099_2-20121227/1705_1 /ASSEMBLY_ACC=CAM_ASM_000209 /TAXON_ID=96639 /ORGANISM=" , Strain NY0313808BC1" /LENGTH=219 /DNA_ID=CAMNT_0050665363 /DNA_START=355 /DNA_END=1014 /DNA_ORIENTATION=+
MMSRSAGKSNHGDRLKEAQIAFQQVTKKASEELQLHGMSENDAVKVLLGRIASKRCNPSKEQVEEFSATHGVSEIHALRALIVGEELRRLRRLGFDSLAAVEEITRKVQLSYNSNKDSRPVESRKRSLVDESPLASVMKRLKRFATLTEVSEPKKEVDVISAKKDLLKIESSSTSSDDPGTEKKQHSLRSKRRFPTYTEQNVKRESKRPKRERKGAAKK